MADAQSLPSSHSATGAGRKQNSAADAIPFCAGLSRLASAYDALLCDVWGVLHNGVQAWPEAMDALSRYRAGGGRIVLISNAPRSQARTRLSLAALGIDDALYDAVVTSGDVTRHVLASGEYGQCCYYLGPRRDMDFLQESGLTAVEAEAAEVILCMGMRDDERERVEDYRPLLQSLAGRGLKMVCANPDLVVKRGGHLVPCAGSLAALYQESGGAVLYFGKPHERIYRHAWEILEQLTGAPMDKKKALAVGDGMGTDILGAARFGLDALFITGGIAAAALEADARHSSEERLAQLCAAHGVRPIAAMTHLCWR